jgi:hypothetical protein
MAFFEEAVHSLQNYGSPLASHETELRRPVV